ncbi:MAG: PEP-CTERM sorting domain-containing protein [Myxococcota bacterium]
MKLAIRTYLHIYAALLGVLVASEAMAVPLEDSGTHLTLTGTAIPTHLSRTATGNTVSGPWAGSWAVPADADWIGTFAVTGPMPAGTASNTGVSTYNFAGMPAGVLPVGTLFRFGDFDTGSGDVETITLSALNAGGVILAPWLEGLASYTPLGIDSTGSGAVVSDDLPGWDFDSATGVYTFDGQTVAGVVNVAFAFESNIAMSGLVVNRNSEFANFTLGAPVVPEPGTMVLMGAGLAVAVLVGRRSMSEK